MAKPEHTNLIEALYELPLGGHWSEVHKAMCRYWSDLIHESEANQQRSLADLERHMERTLKLLKQAPTHLHAWRDQLHAIPLPACVLDGRGALIETNRRGQRYTTLLKASGSSIRAVLKQSGPEPGTQPNDLRAIVLPDGERRHELFLRVLDSSDDADAPLFLGILTATPEPADGASLLRERFELTPKEAELCLDLAGGRSLDDLVKAERGTRNTLRTHLSRSFSKLGVSSQPELVAKVLQTLFTLSQLEATMARSPTLGPYIDPAVHGTPSFRKITLHDGRALGYFEYGDADGFPVLLLHGTLDCGLIRREAADAIVGRGIRLIAVERGGVGETDPNPDPSPQGYARDLGELLDQLGIIDCAIMGRSMGCWDAFTAAAAHRDRVRALVLVSTRLPVRKTSDHEEHGSFYRSVYNSIWRSDAVGTLMLQLMRVQLLVTGPERFLEWEGLPPSEIEALKDERYIKHLRSLWLRSGHSGAGALNAHIKLYRDPIEDPPWLHCEMPTLQLHGKDDTNVTLESALKHTETFKRREVVVYDNIGHRLIHLRLPELIDTVRGFCESLEMPKDASAS